MIIEEASPFFLCCHAELVEASRVFSCDRRSRETTGFFDSVSLRSTSLRMTVGWFDVRTSLAADSVACLRGSGGGRLARGRLHLEDDGCSLFAFRTRRSARRSYSPSDCHEPARDRDHGEWRDAQSTWPGHGKYLGRHRDPNRRACDP